MRLTREHQLAHRAALRLQLRLIHRTALSRGKELT